MKSPQSLAVLEKAAILLGVGANRRRPTIREWIELHSLATDDLANDGLLPLAGYDPVKDLRGLGDGGPRGEEWLHCPDMDNNYAVSSFGRVFSKMSTPYHTLCQQKSIGGYLTIAMTVGDKKKAVTVHSLVMRAFVGTRPIGYVIDHKNELKTDNRLCNLSYCTPAENSRRHHSLKRRGVALRSES